MHPTDSLMARAVLSAGAYAPERRAASVRAPIPAAVLVEIRRARVELYCGHEVQAVAEIRAAREELRRCAPPLNVVALQALDAASWLVRHGHTQEAEDALDAALARLDAAGTAA